MANQSGKEIAKRVREKMVEFKKVCEGLDEDGASKAPEGRWSPKQIISHLCGPEDRGLFPTLKSFLEQDKPEVAIEGENPHWSGKRRSMSLSELLSEFDREYTRIATFNGAYDIEY